MKINRKYISVSKRATIFFVLIAFFFLAKDARAQCSIGTSSSVVDIDTIGTGVLVEITNNLNAGKYVTLNNLFVGSRYTIEACGDFDNIDITLFNSSNTVVAFDDSTCFDDGKIVFIPTVSGTYYAQINIGPSCGSDMINHSLFVTKSCIYNPCSLGLQSSTYNTSSLTNDVRTSVTTSLNTKKYVKFTNIVANTTYKIDVCGATSNLGITVFDAANNVVAYDCNSCFDDGIVTFIPTTSGDYRAQINVVGNCTANSTNNTMYITKSSCNNPTVPVLSIPAGPYCYSDSIDLTIMGNLNDAIHWVLYKDSCGGEELDSTNTSLLRFKPLQGTRKYFVRGEDASGCVFESGVLCDSIEITTLVVDAGFSYNASSYCTQDNDTIPTITGLSGGVFSATPVGLVINSSTGEIDMSASTAGNYTINYTVTSGTCTASNVFSVSIAALDNTNFNYNNANYCKYDLDPIPSILGVNGGTFSASTGLSLDPTSGLIDLSTSTAATYSVSYTSIGNCASTSTFSVSVNGSGNPSFSYPNNSACVSGSDPIATLLGLTGGAFSSAPTGMSINSATGLIDLSTSTPGTYNVKYTTNETCPMDSVLPYTVQGMDNASFFYGTSLYCTSNSDPTPSITGLIGGVFSSSPVGLLINASSGVIDVSASALGAYTITYTTAGSCPNSSSQVITISGLDNAGFNYAAASYCQSGSNPTPTVTGLSGGVFAYSPSGLAINSSTGEITLSSCFPNTYTITYTTNGGCTNSSTLTLTINSSDNSGYFYDFNAYCATSADPTPTVTGLAGGTFSSSPVGMTINSASGLIDIANSSIGSYTISYATNGSCPVVNNQIIEINNFDDASFNYGASSYCPSPINVTPTVTGLIGGSFSSTPVGLSLSQSSGIINVNSSTAGTYTVNYTTSGNCVSMSTESVIIKETDDASFSYDNVVYCANDANPTPTISGLVGGVFSALPNGLDINFNSGLVTVSNSTPDTYTVTYRTQGNCPDSISKTLIVTAPDDAGFSFSSSSFCTFESNPTPTITGLSAGSFSASPAGLSIHSSTGTIDLNASSLGTYTVSYTTNGDCPNTATQIINVHSLDDASFNYSASLFCATSADPLPTIAGVAGGVFTVVPAGMAINSATGEIDISATTFGVYTVTYSVNGNCPNSSLLSIAINALDDPSFSFSNASYCISDADPTPVVSGLSGGFFTATPAGLDIDIITGIIDLSSSLSNVYTVLYTTNGSCPNTSTQTITINTADNASFSYSSASYCTTGVDPIPSISGLIGGVFSCLDAALVINSATGEIDLDLSPANAYAIEYSTNGSCPNTSTQLIQLNNLDDASFSYSQTSYCIADVDPTPNVTSLLGGSYSASPSGLSINTSTGMIDLSASVLGVYLISHTSNGNCPNTSTQSITINSYDDASFSYSANSYCYSNLDPTPVITGISGGVFSYSPSGLSLNISTGLVDISASLFGTYTITYSTTGNCQGASTQTITITGVDDASFSYLAPNYCELDNNPLPIITGLTGGGFSSSPSGLNINASLGVIDIATSTPGTYAVSYTTATSCPTTSTQTIVISSVPITNQSLSSCDSLILNGATYFNSQVINDTLSGILCDSIVNTVLTINNSSVGTDVVTACNSYHWIDGSTYTSNTNNETFVLTNSVGCDSLVSLDLSIQNIDTTLSFSGTTITANAMAISYQWLDCNSNYLPITGATNQMYTITTNGSYAVIVSNGNCADTTACIDITNLGLESNLELLEVNVFPNPFEDVITIEFETFDMFEITVSNIEGKIVYKANNRKTITSSNLEKGIYIVTVLTKDKYFYKKIIKL